MRRVVVVGLVGGAVAVTAVALARRRAATPMVFGQPDWAPLSLAGPTPAPAVERPAEPVGAPPAERPAEPPQARVAPLTDEQIAQVTAVEPIAAVGDTTDATDEGAAAPEPSVAALDDGSCPLSHPVKASATGIYHLPGGRFYDSLRAKRCYRDAEAAEADGLRPSKR